MSETYKNIIFTKHAYDRIKQRSVSMHAIYETVAHPEKTSTKSGQNKKYIKTISGRKYHVVATYKPDQKKYLVISAWVRGEDDTVPLIWQLLTLPFKLLWWVLKLIFRIIRKLW